MPIFLKSNLIHKLFIVFAILIYNQPIKGSGIKLIDTNKKTQSIYSFNTQYGFIIIHRSYIQHFSQSHFSIFQGSISKQTDGSLLWHNLYRRPRVGFNMIYTNFTGNTLLKSALGAQGHIDFCRNVTKKNTLHLRLAAGIGYIKTPFDRDNNFKNIAIGTHFNGLVQVGLLYQFKISNRLHGSINSSIIHFSNGAIKVPNLGINIASAGIGLHFSNSKIQLSSASVSVDSIIQKKYFEIFVGAGVKQNYPPSSTSFGVVSGRVQYYFRNRLKNNFSVGLDIFNDNGMHRKMLEDNLVNNDNKVVTQLGLNFQYQQNIHRVSIPIFIGTYIFSNYKGNGFMYHGLGIKYKINEHLSMAVILKTHYARADYFLWGLGYKL